MAKSKANKDQEENSGSNAPRDDEDFGLPELEYEALDDDESSDDETPAEEESSVYSSPSFDEPTSSSDDDSKVSSIFDVEDPSTDEISDVFGGSTPPTGTQQPFYGEEEGNSAKSFTRIIIIGAIAFVLIGFAFLYWHHKDDDKKVVAKSTPKEQKVEPKPLEPKPEPVKVAPVKKEPVKPVNTSGEVATLTEKTGRSYVVVGSFFDGDLAEDYGKKLANEGMNATVIKPFGKSRFYRVSISDFESYQEAVDEAEKAKSTYGGEVWALRY